MFPPALIHAYNPGPMTGAGNNTYLLAGGGRGILIDAGIGRRRHLADLDRALQERTSALETVLVTHAHKDHAGGVEAIAAAHPAASFAKWPWAEEDEQYGVPWRALDNGEVIDCGGEPLTVMHTPGHSPDHVSFWHAPSRTVFSGDLVVLGSSVMIHSSRGGNLGEYMSSLERLLALEPRVLLPAHGRAIDDPRSVLTGYLEHRRMREQQVIEALEQGHATVEAIAESIYHGLDASLLPAARENVRAHLEKLKSDRRASDAAGRWRL